jgi:hypothetical protein
VNQIDEVDVDALANSNMSPEEIMAFLKKQNNKSMVLMLI